jgi:hypothetical protein
LTFLEETFSAPPAARASPAPEGGTGSQAPPARADRHQGRCAGRLDASGYGSRPEDFDDLIRILDSEIRLITPTDPEGKEADGDSVLQTRPGQKYYQLTHDYLVHSLREWLTRKQKETRRGRAELKLAERSGLWNAKPENRHLPTLWEWLGIRTLTHRRRWTDQERAMMQRASRFHRSRLTIAAVLVGLLTAAGFPSE